MAPSSQEVEPAHYPGRLNVPILSTQGDGRFCSIFGDLGEDEAATSGLAGERHFHRVNPLPFDEHISLRFLGPC